METAITDDSRQRLFVVGMGGGGSNLTVGFQNPPDWLTQGDAIAAKKEYYPVEVAVFDTNEQAKLLLKQHFGFTGTPYIVTGLTRDQLLQFFTQRLGTPTVGDGSSGPAGRQVERISAGAGRHPLLAREMAIRNLVENGDVIAANLRSTYMFRKGAIITAHTVNGGTGSGISPVIMDFLTSKFFEQHPGLALDLAILPETNVIRGASGFYPANAIVSLNQILKQRTIPDAVILIDNEHVRKVFGAKNNLEINRVVRNAMLPLMLCSEAALAWPYFGDQPDLSNIRSFIRPGKGFGLATFCTVGYAVSGSPGRFKGLSQFFKELVGAAFQQTMIDLQSGTGTSDEALRPDSAIAVFVASPEFYEKRLGNDSSSVTALVDEVVRRVGVTSDKRCLIHYIAVPGISEVMLSLLLSGVESQKLRLMWSMAHGIPMNPQERTVDAIRNIPLDRIEELAFREIREHIKDLIEQ